MRNRIVIEVPESTLLAMIETGPLGWKKTFGLVEVQSLVATFVVVPVTA